jgi:hypothetical protein
VHKDGSELADSVLMVETRFPQMEVDFPRAAYDSFLKVPLCYLYPCTEPRTSIDFHSFRTVDSQMAIRAASRAGRLLPPGELLLPSSVRGFVGPGAIMQLQGLDRLEKSIDVIGNRTLELRSLE